MHYSAIGVLTVHASGSTVRISRTSDDATVAELTLAEAHELAPLLHRVLRLHGTNPGPPEEHPHPFTTG